jgi:hypothetical protein
MNEFMFGNFLGVAEDMTSHLGNISCVVVMASKPWKPCSASIFSILFRLVSSDIFINISVIFSYVAGAATVKRKHDN